MEVYDDTEVFIVCPACEKSGGPFALHQLAHELRKRKIDAMMAYTGTARDENPVAEPYRKYHIPFVTDEVVRGEHNILICPETMVGSFPRHMRHIFWWLSVDNWAKTIRQQLDRALYTSFAQPLPGFISPTGEAGTHWAQSEYAERFLRMNHVPEQKIHHVSDYLDPIFLSRHADDAFDVNGRRDIVAYNPAKGAAFTRKLQQAAPDIHWVRIEHMTEREVEDCLSQAKVYIDFGGHPGKDRIPREAAICGCCVVTGRRGAAGNDVDVPINQSYKFADCEENIPSIIDCVRALLAEYPQRLADFAAYRALIRREKHVLSARSRQRCHSMAQHRRRSASRCSRGRRWRQQRCRRRQHGKRAKMSGCQPSSTMRRRAVMCGPFRETFPSSVARMLCSSIRREDWKAS